MQEGNTSVTLREVPNDIISIGEMPLGTLEVLTQL